MASVVDEIAVCGLVVRPHEHVVLAQGNPVDLTSREFEILMKLAEHPGWVFSPEQLASEEGEADYSPESVSVLVSRMRQKLARGGSPDVVETVRGMGYRLRVPLCDGEDYVGIGTGVLGALRDATWHLLAAVLEVDRAGSAAQQAAAVDALESARSSIYGVLAEPPGSTGQTE